MPSKRNLFFKKGAGLTLDDWISIGSFLFPEDLMNLRATCKLQALLFPHLLQILMDMWVSRMGTKWDLASLEMDLLGFLMDYGQDRLVSLKMRTQEFMENFFCRIGTKRFVKKCWRPHVEALVLLLRCYESVCRGRAIVNLGWYYRDSLFGEKTFDVAPNSIGNFKKVKWWFGGLDSRRRKGGQDPKDHHLDASATASVKAIKDRRKLYSIGCGTVYADWTWLDPRELEPSLVQSFSFYVEHLKSLILRRQIANSDKTVRTPSALNKTVSSESDLEKDSNIDMFPSPLVHPDVEKQGSGIAVSGFPGGGPAQSQGSAIVASTTLTNPEAANTTNQTHGTGLSKSSTDMAKEDKERKAAFGILEEAPEELIDVADTAVNWLHEAFQLHIKLYEPLQSSRFLLSYLCIAQMANVTLEFSEDQLLVVRTARTLTRSLYSLRKERNLWKPGEEMTLNNFCGSRTKTKVEKKRDRNGKQRNSLSPLSLSPHDSPNSPNASPSAKIEAAYRMWGEEMEIQRIIQIPGQVMLRTLYPRQYMHMYQYPEAGPDPPFSHLGMKFRKHARRIYVAIYIANRLKQLYWRHQKEKPERKSPGGDAKKKPQKGASFLRSPTFALKKPKAKKKQAEKAPGAAPEVATLNNVAVDDKSVNPEKEAFATPVKDKNEAGENEAGSVGPGSAAKISTEGKVSSVGLDGIELVDDTLSEQMEILRKDTFEADAVEEHMGENITDNVLADVMLDFLETELRHFNYTDDDLSDWISAALVDCGVKALASEDEPDMVGNAVGGSDSKESVGRSVQDSTGKDDDFTPCNSIQDTNPSKTLPQLKNGKTLHEVINEEYRKSAEYEDRILPDGIGSRGHLVTKDNNNSVRTVLNDKKGTNRIAGKKAVQGLVDLYMLPKLHPQNQVNHKTGRLPMPTRAYGFPGGM